MKENTSTWKFICQFINSYEDGSILTRKKLIEDFKKQSSRYTKTSTIDGYRHLLTRIKVLEHISLGKYKKIQNIPESLTSVKARRLATQIPSWKDWFPNSLEDRVRLL